MHVSARFAPQDHVAQLLGGSVSIRRGDILRHRRNLRSVWHICIYTSHNEWLACTRSRSEEGSARTGYNWMPRFSGIYALSHYFWLNDGADGLTQHL